MVPKTHYLKTWPLIFTAVKEEHKTFEIRKNDRGFQVGDLLILQEYLPTNGEYTGKEIQRIVTYILEGDKYGVEKGYVCMSIEPVKPK
jgi:hypothetical protein